MSILTTMKASAYNRAAFRGFVPGPAFCRANAAAMMWLAQLAYEASNSAKVAGIAERWGLAIPPGALIARPLLSPLPLTKAVALVARSDTSAFIAFAGTDPLVLSDWVADFDIAMNGDVANGFSMVAAAVLPAIREALQGLDLPLYITGHSLGGAVAVLVAQALAAEGKNIDAVYTFGMPRAGNEQFRMAYNDMLGSRTYRLVNGVDIVPSVAPSFMGFRHVGRLMASAEGGLFQDADLEAEAGSDFPAFQVGMIDAMLQRLGKALHLGDAGGPGAVPPDRWIGRSKAISSLLDVLPDTIKAHLPDSYLTALQAVSR